MKLVSWLIVALSYVWWVLMVKFKIWVANFSATAYFLASSQNTKGKNFFALKQYLNWSHWAILFQMYTDLWQKLFFIFRSLKLPWWHQAHYQRGQRLWGRTDLKDYQSMHVLCWCQVLKIDCAVEWIFTWNGVRVILSCEDKINCFSVFNWYMPFPLFFLMSKILYAFFITRNVEYERAKLNTKQIWNSRKLKATKK